MNLRAGAADAARRAFDAHARGDPEAVALFAAAITLAPWDPALRIGEAEARVQAGVPDPLGPLAALVAHNPGWVQGQATLASLRWETGDKEGFTDGFRSALRTTPSNAALWNGLIQALADVGDYLAAADAARDARRHFDVPMLRLIEASHAGTAGAVERAGALLEHIPAGMPERRPVDVRHRLRTGDPEAAGEILDRLRAEAPADIATWALTEIVWRILGDRRAAWLSGQRGLVAEEALGLSDAELDALAETLRAIHRMRAQPLGQSVRGGTQTRGRLFDRADPPIRRLQEAIQAALDRYRAALPPPDPAHPLLRHRDRPLRADGGWSVRLSGEGYHVPHLHPAGIVSSASYIALPPLDGASREGWLELGRPPADLLLDLEPLVAIEPRPGKLALFPSFLYHGTRPFPAGERLTVAFDAA